MARTWQWTLADTHQNTGGHTPATHNQPDPAQANTSQAARQPANQPTQDLPTQIPDMRASDIAHTAGPDTAAKPVPLYVLFPGAKAVPLSQIVDSEAHLDRMQAAHAAWVGADGAAAAAAAAAPAAAATPQPVGDSAAAAAGNDGGVSTQQGCVSDERAGGVNSGAGQLAGSGNGGVQGVVCERPPAYVLLAVDGTWKQVRSLHTHRHTHTHTHTPTHTCMPAYTEPELSIHLHTVQA